MVHHQDMIELLNQLRSKDERIAELKSLVASLTQSSSINKQKINGLLSNLPQLFRRVSDCSSRIDTHITSHRSASKWTNKDIALTSLEEQMHRLKQR